MGFFDTSVQRESACPVHFIWDGNGYGRPLVRIGFLLLLVAGAALTMGRVVPSVLDIGQSVFAVAVAVWLLGQIATRRSRPRPALVGEPAVRPSVD